MERQKKADVYVIIHGFGGSADEIEYLAQYLRAKGLDIRTVSLAGHGGTKRELAGSSYPDWINSVKNSINELAVEYQNINLIGFSLGGLLSAHFASIDSVKKVVFINTPIYLWNIKLILRDFIHDIHGGKFSKIDYYRKSVSSVSIKSGIDFLIVLGKTKKMFASVSKPSLILQCKNDETAYYKSAVFIKEKIGISATLLYYDGGCHQVFTAAVDLRDKVCADIYNFLITPNTDPHPQPSVMTQSCCKAE